MSDEDIADSGPLVGSEIAPSPAETPSEPARPPIPEVRDQPSHTEIIKERFADGLALAAHGTSDASDYIRERKIQEKYLNDEPISPTEGEEWHRRTRAALQRAADNAARMRGEVPPSEQQPEAQPPNYIRQDDPAYSDAEAATQQSFQQFYRERGISDQKAYIEACSQIINEAGADGLIGYMAKAPEVAPQMMEWLVYQPDKARAIAQMPLAEQAHAMAAVQGYAYAVRERELQEQNGQYQQPQVRKVTQAPPIIRSPRGAASPPVDIYGLAGKDDVTSYVRARQAMDKRSKD